MSTSVRRAVGVTRSMVSVVQNESVTFVAASLAYYAFVSLLPLLLLALVVASVLGGPEVADQVATRVTDALGAGAGDVVRDALTGAAGRGGATLFGLAVLLWSALKVFRGLDVAFSQVYGGETTKSIVDQIGDAFVVLAAVGSAIALTVVVGTVLALPGLDVVVLGVDLVSVLGSLLLVVALSVTLLPLYYFLPDQEIGVGDALPGAVFAAVGWTLLQTGFRVYAGNASSYEAYGVIGGVLLLVTLLYFGGVILLLGVALNAVLDGHIGAQAEALGIDAADLEQAVTDEDTLMTDDEQTDDEEPADLSELPLEEQVEALRDELEEKSRNRDDMERDLRRYVRRRVRRGKARGWGPYIVLLYGTAMTLGAFYLLNDWAAVVAMFVVWTSTLGLYVLMLLVGVGLNVAGVPGRIRDAIEARR